MITRPIPRKRGARPDEFARDHLEGAGAPVIVTDAIDAWPARTEWTFGALGARYGNDLVSVSTGLMSTAAKVTKLSAFIEHLVDPARELQGFWVDRVDGAPTEAPHQPGPFYLIDWNAFELHPELFDAIRPAPCFVDDWELALNAPLRQVFENASGHETTSLYIGAPGALSPLHDDYWQTHAWLAQVQGSKEVALFAAADSHLLERGCVDPLRRDAPNLAGVSAWVGTIGPGDVLFIPARWWHWVRSLDSTITVSHNFFNRTNVNEHLAELLRHLPR